MNRIALLYLITETGPVIAFFIAGQLSSFANAVLVLMITTTAASTVSWQLERHLPVLPILSAIVVLGGGGITLFFDNPDAIILSDTVYYGITAAILGMTLLQKKLILKQLFGRVFAVTDQGWWALSRNWLVLLSAAAFSNELVRFFATPEWWIEYRFYKTFLILLFAASQFYVSRHYRIESASNAWGIRVQPRSDQARL